MNPRSLVPELHRDAAADHAAEREPGKVQFLLLREVDAPQHDIEPGDDDLGEPLAVHGSGGVAEVAETGHVRRDNREVLR